MSCLFRYSAMYLFRLVVPSLVRDVFISLVRPVMLFRRCFFLRRSVFMSLVIPSVCSFVVSLFMCFHYVFISLFMFVVRYVCSFVS